MRAYEGLFLVDDNRASDNLQEVMDHIRGLLERHGATVQKLEKWDSRRLAYEIQGKRRGTYIIAKFDGDPAQIAALEHDCRISTTVMRAMVLLEENVGITLEEAEDAVRAKRRERAKASLGGDDEGEDTDGGDDDGGDDDDGDDDDSDDDDSDDDGGDDDDSDDKDGE